MPEYLAGDGTGGIHVPRNLDLYTYAWNNPLRMKDMDGRQAYPHTYWTPAEHAQAYCNNRGGCTEAEYRAEVNRWGGYDQVGQDIVLNGTPGGKVSKTLYQAAKKTPWFKRAWQWVGRALFGAFRNHAKKLDDAADRGVDPGGSSAPPAPTTPAGPLASKSVPDKVTEVLRHVRDADAAPSGYRGGRTFDNDGRGGGQVLPTSDALGNPVSYREWDVNPYQKGVNRGAERLVTGSDGRAYYTDNHYKTFTEVQ